MLGLLFPLIVFGALYFLLILPQRRKQRAQEEMIRNVQEGDEIVTVGGIHGGVIEVEEDVVYVEIAPDVEIKLAKRAIAERKVAPSEPAEAEDDADEEAPSDSSVQDGSN